MLILPFQVECRWRVPQRVVKLWPFLHTIWPSLLEACSSRSALRSVFFLDSNHCKTACSSGSSFWAATQLVTCISTRTCPAVTHTSSSLCWSLSITAGFSPSTLWGAPIVAPSRMACMASGPRQVVIWLNASATVFISSFLVFQLEIEFC